MNDEKPTECGDPTCAGHVDETTGECILCGVDHTSPCPECDCHGFHGRGCSEREADPMDLADAHLERHSP